MDLKSWVIQGNQYFLVNRRDGTKGLFCPTTHEFYKKGLFTQKQKKHFRILRSGFELCYARDEKLVFLTLTTQYDIKKIDGVPVVDANGKHIALYPRKMHEKQKGLNHAFTKLKQSIERKIQVIMYERYCKRRNIQPYVFVGRKNRKKIAFKHIFNKFKYKLRYFKVKTSEGGGVLHIVIRKAYNIPSIPFFWLRKKWFSIWGAEQGVNIKMVRISDVKGLSMYMVGQYFAKQPVIRMSYGYSWACVGMKKRIDKLIDDYGFKKGVNKWVSMMQYNLRPTGSTGYQKRLYHRKIKPGLLGVLGEKSGFSRPYEPHYKRDNEKFELFFMRGFQSEFVVFREKLYLEGKKLLYDSCISE